MRPRPSNSSEPIALSPASPRFSVRRARRAPWPRLSQARTPPCSSSGCAVVCMALAVVWSLSSFCHVPDAPRSSGSAAAPSGTAAAAAGNRRARIPAVVLVFFTIGSVVELQGELHLARVAERAGDPAERGRAGDVRGRDRVVHPVEHVVGLDAQLDAAILRQREASEERQVEVLG